MDETTYACLQGAATHVLSAGYVDRLVVAHGTPDTHHGREMKDALRIPHGSNERLRLTDVTRVDGHAVLRKPTGILAWQQEGTDAVTAFLQSIDQVMAEEPVGSGDQRLDGSTLLIATHSTLDQFRA